MIKNYLKIAFRNLLKNKVYSFINVLGLSVASAFCLLVYLQVQFEYSYDKFHKDHEQIHIIEMTNFTDIIMQKYGMNIGVKRNSTTMPIALGPDLKQAIPEIKFVTRIKETSETFKTKEKTFTEKNGLFVDKNFLEVFTFPLQLGDKSNALNTHNSLIVSQKFAKKYFGTIDVIGKNISSNTDSRIIYTITGILKDIPNNSSMQFDFLLPIEGEPDYVESMANSMNSFNTITAVELDKNTSIASFNAKLHNFGLKYFDEYLKQNKEVKPKDFIFTSIPISSINSTDTYPWFHSINTVQINNLSYLAILILVLACLNYILLSVANAARKMQEAGIRKIVGASKSQIIAQFFIDTLLIASISIIIGFIITNLALPFYNNLLESRLKLLDLSLLTILSGLIGIALIISILAGLYPAILVSKKSPLAFLSKNSSYRVNPIFYRTMVIIQYSLSLVMLSSILVIYLQMKHIGQQDLGFNKEQIVIVNNNFWGEKEKTKLLTERIHQYALQNKDILDVSAVSHTFGMYDMNMDSLDNRPIQYAVYDVDYNYLPFLGVKFIAGRNFSKQFSTDTLKKEAIIVNQKLFESLGKNAKIGEYNTFLKSKIIGVVKDFASINSIDETKPTVIRCNPGRTSKFYFRMSANNMAEKIQKIESDWKQLSDFQPFEYNFLDEKIEEGYKQHLKLMKTTAVATFFAILIAFLGLFGLSGITAANRTKEIGIRKIMGANIKQLLILLNKDTTWLTMISFLVSTPVSYYFIKKWLENFAFRIELDWKIFLVAGLIGLLIALLAVSYQSIKAASQNPVKSLKTE